MTKPEVQPSKDLPPLPHKGHASRCLTMDCRLCGEPAFRMRVCECVTEGELDALQEYFSHVHCQAKGAA